MPKATLTFEDDGEGELRISLEFDPPIDKNSNTVAASHHMAAKAWELFLDWQHENSDADFSDDE